QYDWLEISEPAVSTKAASMNYNYTFSLKENYTLGRYPRAVLRFTNTMNGSETARCRRLQTKRSGNYLFLYTQRPRCYRRCRR
ncbi:hypothetical protein, partial [Parabacteroides goldsteinii]|uniref:hypothetical protein n=1 Tax=Parabacteroides goldsteinii TaxID=328812 RepID=UPI0022E000EA